MRLLKYFSIIVLIAVIGFYVRQGQPQYQTFQGKIFGTYYQIKIRTEKKDKTLHDKIKAELALVNQQMSVFEKDSEISQINQTPAHQTISLSPEMGMLLSWAQKIHQQTNGAFDPTVAPLVDIWGFGTSKPQQEPTPKDLETIFQAIGFDKLVFDADFSTLQKKNSQTTLNLSAIAKGYGVDKVASLLEKEGYEHYVVEIGGEVRLKGRRDNSGTPWSVGIKEPKVDGMNSLVMDLSDTAIATSGDYQNFRKDSDGQTYSHIISPQTGYPAQTDLASVTVFADLCLQADAYATALMTMGFEQAKAFADKYKLKVIFFRHTANDSFIRSYSAEAQNLLGE